METQSLSSQFESRAKELARMIGNGGRQFDCIRYAAIQWGLDPVAAEALLSRARDLIKDEWTGYRQQVVADLLAQAEKHRRP